MTVRAQGKLVKSHQHPLHKNIFHWLRRFITDIVGTGSLVFLEA